MVPEHGARVGLSLRTQAELPFPGPSSQPCTRPLDSTYVLEVMVSEHNTILWRCPGTWAMASVNTVQNGKAIEVLCRILDLGPVFWERK